jgi:hypothetical protein
MSLVRTASLWVLVLSLFVLTVLLGMHHFQQTYSDRLARREKKDQEKTREAADRLPTKDPDSSSTRDLLSLPDPSKCLLILLLTSGPTPLKDATDSLNSLRADFASPTKETPCATVLPVALDRESLPLLEPLSTHSGGPVFDSTAGPGSLRVKPVALRATRLLFGRDGFSSTKVGGQEAQRVLDFFDALDIAREHCEPEGMIFVMWAPATACPGLATFLARVRDNGIMSRGDEWVKSVSGDASDGLIVRCSRVVAESLFLDTKEEILTMMEAERYARIWVRPPGSTMKCNQAVPGGTFFGML